MTNSKLLRNPTNTQNTTTKQSKNTNEKSKIQGNVETSENLRLKEAIKEAQNMVNENETKIMKSGELNRFF